MLRRKERIICTIFAFACAVSVVLHEGADAKREEDAHSFAARRLAAKPWYVRNIRLGGTGTGITLPISYVTALILFFSVCWAVSALTGGAGGKGKGAYVEASHILVTDLANGKAILETLKAEIGNSYEMFAQKAAKISTCPSRKQGGNLGRFPPNVMAPTFDRLCFDPASPVHTTLGPIQSPFGWHLIYIHERKLS
jgi:peptidyl-prolyl cis-trans isomerase C